MGRHQSFSQSLISAGGRMRRHRSTYDERAKQARWDDEKRLYQQPTKLAYPPNNTPYTLPARDAN